MKLLKNIFALILIVSLASCSSDDDNNVYVLNNANVAGTYNLTKLETREVITTNVSGVDILTVTTTTAHTFQLEMIFSENGNYLTDGEFVNDYRVEVAGDLYEEGTEIIVIDAEEGTYTTNSTSMVMVLDGEVYDVTYFDEYKIKLNSEETYVENGDEVVFTQEIILVRQ